MPQTLEALERQRTKLYEQLQAVGDFRPGTISVNFRKCGKKNCACSQPGHPGHGPQYMRTLAKEGKNRAHNLRLGPELEKAVKEADIEICHWRDAMSSQYAARSNSARRPGGSPWYRQMESSRSSGTRRP